MTLRPQKIAVYGFYKTGTTALFYRIKRALSYSPRTLFEARCYEESPNDGHRGVLAKVILNLDRSGTAVDYASFAGFDKKLFIIRDPRDWLISGTLFLIQQNPSIYLNDKLLADILQLLERKVSNPHSVSLLSILLHVLSALPVATPEKLLEEIRNLHELSFRFEDSLKGHALARYEDFVNGEVEHLSDYLGCSLNQEPTLEREHQHVMRTCSSGDWRNWFTAEDTTFFKEAFRDYIAKYNYDDAWLLNEKPVIESQHAHLYVERTVALRKAGPLSGTS